MSWSATHSKIGLNQSIDKIGDALADEGTGKEYKLKWAEY